VCFLPFADRWRGDPAWGGCEDVDQCLFLFWGGGGGAVGALMF